MLEIHAGKMEEGVRLDKYLQKTFPRLPRSAMFKAVRNKKIKINRKRCETNQILHEGDSILLFLAPDFLYTENKELSALSDKPLQVLYEDGNLIAVYKPAGLLVQKDSAEDQDTLNGRLLQYLKRKGEYDPKRDLSFTPSAVHRLDRNTSGIVLAAKNPGTARILSDAIAGHRIGKSYLALAKGRIEKPQDIRLYLKKEDLLAKISDEPKPGYDEALMQIRPLRFTDRGTWLDVDLQTGRFHQIRASLAHLGHPIIGDPKYGEGKPGDHQQLQAWKVNLSRAGLDGAPEEIELPRTLRIDSAA